MIILQRLCLWLLLVRQGERYFGLVIQDQLFDIYATSFSRGSLLVDRLVVIRRLLSGSCRVIGCSAELIRSVPSPVTT